MLKNSKVVLFCHLKKLVRPETFGPYHVPRINLISIVVLYDNAKSDRRVPTFRRNTASIFTIVKSPD